MIKNAVLGILRHILTTAGGFLGGEGVLTGDDVNAAVGAIMTIIGIAWSAFDKYKTEKKIEAASTN